jgi:hypothetical protein
MEPPREQKNVVIAACRQLAIRRVGVTVLSRDLLEKIRNAGLIRYSHWHIVVLDHASVESRGGRV